MSSIPQRSVSAVRRGFAGMARLVVLVLFAAAQVCVLTLPAAIWLPEYVAAAGLTVLVAIPACRVLPVLSRKSAPSLYGRAIESPYLPLPVLERTENGWYWNGYDFHRSRWVSLAQRRGRWFFTDPATWRDLCWLVVNPLTGGVVAALPVALAAFGAFLLVSPLTAPHLATGEWYFPLPMDTPAGVAGTAVAGLALLVLGLVAAPGAVSLHEAWTRWLLAPDERTLLARRVERLFATRAAAIDAQAAELRRIERDLHDGAQARLIAIGMSLSTAEMLLDTDLDEVRRQLAGARDLSAAALRELRGLVHGIQPPMLADRGLGAALEDLTMDAPVPTDVEVGLIGRPDAALESAVYFSVAELLANAAKHAAAKRVRVSVTHRPGVLRVVVADDGKGGADFSRGSGLAGVQRRVAAFDGVVEIDSPAGGPTEITILIPCVLPSAEQ
ncbi:histidine kinase [Amycolatopsis sp. FBCC-B4732]|uniref:sensor histidine kinase n=1 Tax=Amycolatopsis sp. FBCC-B4732 TaxID=3079339 RepID=UPI001FF344E7|nr:histidine kinase [Amycolatopsis sp. FBCC-B4732]UOX89581.1 histidine kinase [Amycolatopsis sp. FBCC-B4732]